MYAAVGIIVFPGVLHAHLPSIVQSTPVVGVHAVPFGRGDVFDQDLSLRQQMCFDGMPSVPATTCLTTFGTATTPMYWILRCRRHTISRAHLSTVHVLFGVVSEVVVVVARGRQSTVNE